MEQPPTNGVRPKNHTQAVLIVYWALVAWLYFLPIGLHLLQNKNYDIETVYTWAGSLLVVFFVSFFVSRSGKKGASIIKLIALTIFLSLTFFIIFFIVGANTGLIKIKFGF